MEALTLPNRTSRIKIYKNVAARNRNFCNIAMRNLMRAVFRTGPVVMREVHKVSLGYVYALNCIVYAGPNKTGTYAEGLPSLKLKIENETGK